MTLLVRLVAFNLPSTSPRLLFFSNPTPPAPPTTFRVTGGLNPSPSWWNWHYRLHYQPITCKREAATCSFWASSLRSLSRQVNSPSLITPLYGTADVQSEMNPLLALGYLNNFTSINLHFSSVKYTRCLLVSLGGFHETFRELCSLSTVHSMWWGLRF